MRFKITTVFLFISLNLFSQNLDQGVVIYKIKSINFEAQKNTNIEIQNELNKVVEIGKNQSFTLKFDQNKSQFTLNFFMSPIFSGEDLQYYNSMAAFSFTSGYSEIYFDKINQVEYLKQFDATIFEKKMVFNNWQITNENKKIDSYLCYKATLELPYKNRKGEQKVNLITAWFAPSLPFSYGPKEYIGLPGLILELQEKETTYYATQININPENPVSINFPKGKTVNYEDYEKSINMEFGK